MRRWLLAAAAAGAVLGHSLGAGAQELTFWSHWAAEQIKRDFVERAIAEFEKARGVKIKASWYEKTALYASLKTALRAGQAPDVFYAEPDQVEYMENGLLLDLSPLNWNNIEPWAKEAWSYKGKPYGLPLEAATVELFYNTKLLDDLGVKLPASKQLDQDAFLDLVRKARAKGLTPLALGVGDRPYPGSYLSHEALLKKLGTADYDKLMKGQLKWDDSRVVEALRFVKELVDAKALPTTFTSLKLGEAHTYFHTNPGALTFLNGSWYTSRAFNTPDKGGQPKDFPLGIMQYPALKGAACNECKTIGIGGSYVINAATKQQKLALDFLNSMATPEMGQRWLETVLVQTGIKTDASKVTGPHAGYFKQLGEVNTGVKYYFGQPVQVMTGKPKEIFTQVINNAFPAGSIGVEDVVKQMNAAY